MSVKDPESLVVIEGGQIDSESFSGITVDLYTTGNSRQLIRNLISNKNQTFLSFNSLDLADSIISFTGFSGLNNTRTFFLDFNTFDLAGNTDVFRALLTYPKAEITDVVIDNKNPVSITPFSPNFENLKSLEKKGYFLENSVNFETKDKATFFNLGPKNNYNNFLDKNIQHEIEKKFEKTMKKLSYL